MANQHHYDLIGDPRAVKGGVLRQGMMTDFPATFRYYGPNVTEWNLSLYEIVYEGLLYLHPTTLEYIPGLATHWQISDDRRTFRFRLNANARWSDGMPVTSDDVVASWRLAVDKSLQDPARNLIYGNFEPPVAESKYIVSVRAKTEDWQNFMYFACGAHIGGLFILPAHVLKGLTGETFLKQYNYKFGYPQGYLTRIGSFRDIVRLWWIDPERSRRLDEARRDQSIQLGEGPSDDKYWLEFARLESEGTPGTR
jgi:hypothetical protein